MHILPSNTNTRCMFSVFRSSNIRTPNAAPNTWSLVPTAERSSNSQTHRNLAPTPRWQSTSPESGPNRNSSPEICPCSLVSNNEYAERSDENRRPITYRTSDPSRGTNTGEIPFDTLVDPTTIRSFPNESSNWYKDLIVSRRPVCWSPFGTTAGCPKNSPQNNLSTQNTTHTDTPIASRKTLNSHRHTYCVAHTYCIAQNTPITQTHLSHRALRLSLEIYREQ